MEIDLETLILNKTKAKSIKKVELIQKLWSNYGEILRVYLNGSNYNSIVIKHVKLPNKIDHPRGWNSDISHNRKVKSYQVETQWYNSWARFCDRSCRIPECIHLDNVNDEVVIILEDLNASGFPLRKTSINLNEIKLCISWLANFHGQFLNKKPKGLWDKGSYWHLETRPEELEALKDNKLKKYAGIIDKELDDCEYQTIIHGDAKLANFCFSNSDEDVAAVDFQYTGGGVGVKDLAYFIGSCLYEEECEALEKELLDHYFSILKSKIISLELKIDTKSLEYSWRKLYPVAWTDFHRFLKGWSPGHWKINSYSERLTREVIANYDTKKG